ncbi:hypothetical protein F5Y17DRAFT_414161 [Xylariaceae sp. FL0594]|nr:hypothetical protein F5Y17DRAFT_414161 [Xylariaceae sp. FL0594]
MVSIFGLKIGGDKKKSAKDLPISGPRLQNTDASNPVDDKLGFDNGPVSLFPPTTTPLSRRNSGKSTMSRKNKLRGLKITVPFALNKFSSSAIDLPEPPTLKHHASNPSLGRRLKGDSSTSLSLAPPRGFHSLARPSTSDGKRSKLACPADLRLARAPTSTTSPSPLSPAFPTPDSRLLRSPMSATAPKSQLGLYELKLDLPSDVSTFADMGNFTELVQAPAPLRIKKQPSMRLAANTEILHQTARKPPSPPQSINDKDTVPDRLTELSKTSETQGCQESSLNSSIPSGLEELQNAITNFGRPTLLSPSTTPSTTSSTTPPATSLTTPRTSEDEASAAATAFRPASPPREDKKTRVPIIQNVRAKRDTLTVNPLRRRSLQMKIEVDGGGLVPAPPQSGGAGTPNHERSFPRPPPLNLKTSFTFNDADHDGPRSAPFLARPMDTFTPTDFNNPPTRSHTVVVQGRTTHSRSALTIESQKAGSSSASEPSSPASSSIYGDDEYPASPDSPGPLIPLAGPLASPRFPPSSHFSFSEAGSFVFPGREDGSSNRSLSPAPPLAPPPRSAKRNKQLTPSNPDLASCWPLPSQPPVVASSADRAIMSPSPADSRLRSESESSSPYEPLAPPRIPSAGRTGAESPTFRSFSRPWTPIAAAAATTSDFTACSLKRAETAGPLHGSGSGLGGEMARGLRPPPPPRSATTVEIPKADFAAFEFSSSPPARSTRSPRKGTGETAGGFI